MIVIQDTSMVLDYFHLLANLSRGLSHKGRDRILHTRKLRLVVGATAVSALLLEGCLKRKGSLGDVGQHQLSEASELSVKDCHERRVPCGTLHELILRRKGMTWEIDGIRAPGLRWGWSEPP